MQTFLLRLYSKQIYLLFFPQGLGTKETDFFSVSPPPNKRNNPLQLNGKPCPSPLNIIEVRTIGTILLHAPLADEVARECDGVGVLSSD